MEVVEIGARTPDVCHVIRLGSTSYFTSAGCGEDSGDDTRQPSARSSTSFVVVQRQTSVVRTIWKTIVIPQLQYIDKVVDVSIRRSCRYIGKVVDVPRGAGRAGSTSAARGEDDRVSRSLEKSLRSLKSTLFRAAIHRERSNIDRLSTERPSVRCFTVTDRASSFNYNLHQDPSRLAHRR